MWHKKVIYTPFLFPIMTVPFRGGPVYKFKGDGFWVEFFQRLVHLNLLMFLFLMLLSAGTVSLLCWWHTTMYNNLKQLFFWSCLAPFFYHLWWYGPIGTSNPWATPGLFNWRPVSQNWPINQLGPACGPSTNK